MAQGMCMCLPVQTVEPAYSNILDVYAIETPYIHVVSVRIGTWNKNGLIQETHLLPCLLY